MSKQANNYVANLEFEAKWVELLTEELAKAEKAMDAVA